MPELNKLDTTEEQKNNNSVLDEQESENKRQQKRNALYREMNESIRSLREELTVGRTTDEALWEYIKQPTTSPTIKEKEKERERGISDKDENKRDTELEDIDPASEKESVTEYLGDDDINFLTELVVEFLTWGFESALKFYGRDGTISNKRQERLSKIYTKALKRYDIKLSPIWAMVAVTVIVLGLSAKESKKIETKGNPSAKPSSGENNVYDLHKSNYKTENKEQNKEQSTSAAANL